MILYNVTVSIDPEIGEDWLEWMRTKHIPDVMATGCFLESRISRIHGEEEGGLTYSIMYLCPDQHKMDEYSEIHAPELQKDHSQRYAGRFAAFRTFLSVIEEFRP
ncbi:MAG: hypothetical protein RIT43_1857 [Bacteroidota bacterium]|jgi:hypothetical protein